MRRLLFIIPLILLCLSVSARQYPKREFRGAWIQTVYQSQYAEMDTAGLRRYFDAMVDSLYRAGINALIFQVRPEADAFYASRVEPWSRFLTGEQGVGPEGDWDPMRYLITLCHARNMEFHAWINPYRAQCNVKSAIDSSHICATHPEWLVTYGRQRMFDPGLPEARAHICRVVDDIVSRYDIDALHMDDYFYPYPNGKAFPDTAGYRLYGGGLSLDDWRRDNVNKLVSEVSRLIKKRNPRVRFGISPFGIYRNNTTSSIGSDTRGLQNYDDLYADVLRWVEEGWIDYVVPQLYWEIGHKAACYERLIAWWNEAIGERCQLYIGQDLTRSLDAPGVAPESTQLAYKMLLARHYDHIDGVCFWSGYALLDNYKKCALQLRRDFFAAPALIPPYEHIDDAAPAAVKKIEAHWTADGYRLEWKHSKKHKPLRRTAYYCVYRFPDEQSVDIDNPRALQAIVREAEYLLPYKQGEERWVYAVTAVDYLHNESAPKLIKLRL